MLQNVPSPKRSVYAPCIVCRLGPGVVHPHFHESIELIFTTTGSSTAICNGEKYRLTPGSVLIVPSNEVHYFCDRTEDTAGFVIDIVPAALSGSATKFGELAPISRVWRNPAMDHHLWELVSYLHRNCYCLQQDTGTAISIAILSLLQENIEFRQPETPNTTISKVLEYCQAHYSEPISLNILAQELDLSISHVSHIFTQKLNISFCDYINRLRLNEVIKLLTNPEITITKAANYAGFPTIQTFNRVFMARYGMTPSQYRKKLQTGATR